VWVRVGVLVCAPGVPLIDEAVGRLGEESRLSRQARDASADGGQFCLGGGNVPVGVGQPLRRVETPGEGPEAGEPVLMLTAGATAAPACRWVSCAVAAVAHN
jgi:hypothetical protein